MKPTQIILASLFLLVCSITVWCQSIGDSIADSHIRGNVPESNDFENFLKRDLEAYFTDLKKTDVVVEYQLLRDGPTQTGIAFPKFYAWVLIKENGKLLENGAVKVAAIEKKRFSVYDYLSRADIERDIDKVFQIFPKPVGDKIKERVGK